MVRDSQADANKPFASTVNHVSEDPAESTTIAADTPDYAAGGALDLTEVSFGQALAYVITHHEGHLVERFARDEGGKLYRYSGGRYARHGEKWIRTAVKQAVESGVLSKKWTQGSVDNVIAWIAADAPELEPPMPEYINLPNGLLRVRDRTLLPHDPTFYTPIQLPVRFDPNATCPHIDRFVDEWFPADAVPLAYEIPGYLAVPHRSIHKALLFLGPGGNGKSRYLEMVRRFLGTPNVTAISLHKLESGRFACARLLGKLANICPDLPSEHLSGTSIFKALTGGDPLLAEYKFKESFEFEPFCRLVFSANAPPRSKDSSEGFFQRWLVIPFTNMFRGERMEIPSERLDNMLSTPQEQSGLLNKALDGLQRVKDRSMRFHSCESIERAHAEFHAVTDALAVWLDAFTLDDPEMMTPCKGLQREFNTHCQQTGRSGMSETAFGTKVRKLRPTLDRKQRTFNGHLQWCYLGIGLKNTSLTSPTSPT